MKKLLGKVAKWLVARGLEELKKETEKELEKRVGK